MHLVKERHFYSKTLQKSLLLLQSFLFFIRILNYNIFNILIIHYILNGLKCIVYFVFIMASFDLSKCLPGKVFTSPIHYAGRALVSNLFSNGP